MTLLFSRPVWFNDAKCRGADTTLFFPEQGESARRALEICCDCPVTEECLQYALSNGEREGVWGGKAANGRRNLGVLPTRLSTCAVCEKRFVQLRRGGAQFRYCGDACRGVARRRVVAKHNATKAAS